MDLRKLEYLVALADERNFTRAAERVHITQSGLSAQIRQLERELGAELVDRSGRSVTLTAAGQAAVGPAREALAAALSVRRSVDDVTGLVRGRLVVAMVTACRVEPLFVAVSELHREHPGIDIALREDTSDQMIADVRSGAVDVALVGCVGSPPEDLHARVLARDRLEVLVGPDHPLAARRRITPDALASHPLVCLPVGTGVRGVLDQTLQGRVGARVVAEASSPDTVADLAHLGLGVGVLSESIHTRHDRVLVRKPIHGVAVPVVLALVARRGPDPVVAAFLALCDEAFR